VPDRSRKRKKQGEQFTVKTKAGNEDRGGFPVTEEPGVQAPDGRDEKRGQAMLAFKRGALVKRREENRMWTSLKKEK